MICVRRLPFAILIICALLLTICISSGGQNDSSDLLQDVVSPSMSKRQMAKSMLELRRVKTIKRLIEVVNAPIRKGERWSDPWTKRNIAISLLGEMRATEAAVHIAKWLVPQEGQDAFVLYGRDVEPMPVAQVALGKIGKPATGVLIESLVATSNEKMVGICIETLRGIEGDDVLELLVKKRIDEEQTEKVRQKLRRILQQAKKGG